MFLSPVIDDLIHVLGKLENSSDIDGSCRLAGHLLDILEAADYRTTQVLTHTCIHIMQKTSLVVEECSQLLPVA